MEQTKNEPKNENKAVPGNDKPKKERKPQTEAQRLKRQKMIVLPAIVLVFIGAMWLIFAPSSDKTKPFWWFTVTNNWNSVCLAGVTGCSGSWLLWPGSIPADFHPCR